MILAERGLLYALIHGYGYIFYGSKLGGSTRLEYVKHAGLCL